MDKVLIIEQKNLPELAKMLAGMIKQEMMNEPEAYLTPTQLSERVPVLSRYKIAGQIRTGKYGKKIGAKGNLVAKVEEVKKYNRI
jgi:hypothetical protein